MRNLCKDFLKLPNKYDQVWAFDGRIDGFASAVMYIYVFIGIYLTVISVELRFLGDFELFSLKACSLYHEKLLIYIRVLRHKAPSS